MKILSKLVVRNLKLYLRDKGAVFFSFLSVIIIILMYVFFLGKMQMDNITNEVGDIDGVGWLVSSWIMAGLVTVSTVTIPLGAIGILIDDRDKGLFNDFYTSPISRNVLALSYLISAWVIGFIMVLLNYIIGQIYVVLSGGELLLGVDLLMMLGLIMLSIMAFSSFFFYIANFVKTRNAYATLATLTGTFVGFLGGIYIPIGILSKNVQNVMNIFPTAHAVTLVRRVYMEDAMADVFQYADPLFVEEYKNIYGLNVQMFDHILTNFEMFLSLVLFMLIFYVLSVLKLSKTKLQ